MSLFKLPTKPKKYILKSEEDRKGPVSLSLKRSDVKYIDNLQRERGMSSRSSMLTEIIRVFREGEGG